MPKPDAHRLAARFVAALFDDTAGRPMQWRSIGTIGARARIRDPKQLAQAVKDAEAAGLLTVEAGHSVCLSEKGRQAAR